MEAASRHIDELLSWAGLSAPAQTAARWSRERTADRPCQPEADARVAIRPHARRGD